MLISLHKQRGINLVEVLVTLVITSIGILGLSSLQLQANRSVLDAGHRSQALWLLEDLTNRIRANATALSSYDTGSNPVSCNSAPAKICASYHSGTARIASSADCTNAELAIFDLWESACGFNSSVASSDITRSSTAHFIPNPSLSVTVNTDNSVRLSLSWDTRTSGTDSAGQTIYLNTGSNNQTLRSNLVSVIQP